MVAGASSSRAIPTSDPTRMWEVFFTSMCSRKNSTSATNAGHAGTPRRPVMTSVRPTSTMRYRPNTSRRRLKPAISLPSSLVVGGVSGRLLGAVALPGVAEARKVKVRIPIGHVDHRQALEVVAHDQVVHDTHGPVQLHRLLSDEARRLADVGLGARDGAAPGTGVAVAGIDRGDDGHRTDLLLGDVHVGHAVLQRLEDPDRHTELLAALEVGERRLVEGADDATRFCAQRRYGRIHPV